jgi:hypothetical protein
MCLQVAKEPLDLPQSEQQQKFPTSPYHVKLVGQPGAGQNPAMRRRDVSFQMPLQVAKFAI